MLVPVSGFWYGEQWYGSVWLPNFPLHRKIKILYHKKVLYLLSKTGILVFLFELYFN